MTTKVAPLGLRLFMEGVEVPVIAANVTVQPDMPATASIQIIPTDMSLNFLPRTLTHLFYLDANLSDAEIESARKVKDKTAQTRVGVHGASEVDRMEMNDFAYKILFTGEVIGYNYKKTPSGRQLVLQCMDLSSYWDTCYQFFSDYSAGGNGLTDKTHQFVGAGSGQFDNLGGHQWVISRLITTAPESPEYRNCKGLLGGLIHLLETVGGLRYRSGAFKGYRGVTDFFTIAELRYGLLSMLGAIEADKTSQQLYAAKAFCDWIRNGMTSMGNLVSFRDMLNHINRFIFHNIYPNPCAMYRPGGDIVAKRTIQAGTTQFLDSAAGPAIREDLKKVLTSMLLTVNTLEPVQSGPDVCTFMPDKVIAARYSVQKIYVALVSNTDRVQASKASNASDVVTSLKALISDIQNAEGNLPVDIVAPVIVTKVTVVNDIRQQNVYRGGLQPYRGGSTYTVTTTTGTGMGTCLGDKLQKALADIKSAYDKLWDLLNKDFARKKTQEYKVPGASYLYNQLFLPEAFFVSPPRCNVIFPDQYFDLNYGRNFMREVTRLASTGGLGMLGGGRQGSQLFNTTYLAPPIKDVKGNLLLANMSQGARVLLPHEVHSGIIPKFEWVTDGHRWGVKAQKGRIEKVHYLQRLANFQFFLHRWSARQLTITGIFNPNIVAGLPGVIIDRSAPSPAVMERLERILRRRMLPTQFVGKIFGYTHAIGQTGGSTNIQFAYARTHRGLDDEFLNVLSKEIAEESKSATFEVSPRALATGMDHAGVQEELQKLKPVFVPTPEQGTFGAGEQGTSALSSQTIDPSISPEINMAKAVQLAKTGGNIEVRKAVVRMYVDNKLTANVVVPGLGKVKKVTKTANTYLTEAMSNALGISADYFNAKKKYVTAKEAGVPATIERLAGTAVIEVPEKITISYVQVFGSGRYERTGEAFEDIARPDWFSKDVWSNKNITEKVYKPLLGTMAITDDKTIDAAQQEELIKSWATDQTRRMTNADGTTGTTQTESAVANDVYHCAVVPGSAEESIDGLALVYGMIKEHGGDVHAFIREFTRRPIANMVDILGTQNLEFNDQGKVADPDTMIEGFHSRAFGDYNTDVQLPEKEGASTKAGSKALHALMDGVADPASLKRPGLIGRDEPPTGLRPELDPRGRARGRVRAYVEELQLSRGLLGS